MLDIVASVIGLIVLSPVFLIVSLAIKAEDRGPIFYSQVRLGKGQRPFKMYKFRSMIVDADKKLEKLLKQNEVEGAMFKMKEDPRITNVGRFTRKHSLDELPQLWNVLKGEMSLVGPRPPLEREVADYSEYDKQRLIVKPGCTGFWQVTARNDVDFEGMVNLDLEYIERSSILFDIGILFRTVAIVFKPNGAY
jgi:lipopolysaccharide/colanic/teichoic acid biosynthesis glycosyltransferase